MQVKNSSRRRPRGREFGGARGGEAGAAGVFHGAEFECHVAGVMDDDLVFDGLPEFAGVFSGGVGAFAGDPLLLLDDVGRFGGDFGGDFVGRLRPGAFVAFDRGFVGVGADRRQFVAAGEGLFFADGEFGGPGRGDGFAVGVFEGAEFERHVARVLDDDLVFDGLTEFARHFARGVAGFAGNLLFLADREGGFGADRGRDFVGGLGAGAFVAFDRGFVGVGADRAEHVGAGEGLFFADGEFGGPGRGDGFAVGVFEGGEFERHVAGVLDDDLVFDGLTQFAGLGGGAVAAFAFDPLELFDREARFGGHFGGDFVGGLFAGAFVAFDRGFVAVGADPQRVAAGEGLFFAGFQFARAAGEMPVQLVSVSVPNLSVTLPVFLTTISYSTVWPSLPLTSAGPVGGFAGDALELFDRVGGFGVDFGGDFVGGLFAGAFVAFDRGFVGVGADRAERVRAREALGFADGQFAGAGRRDAFAARCRSGR